MWASGFDTNHKLSANKNFAMQNRFFSGWGWVSRSAIGLAVGLVLFSSLRLRAADPADVNQWIEALRNPDEKARIQTIDALGHLGPAAKSAIKALAAQLADKNALVRAHAAHALELIGPADATAIEALIKATADADASVRRMAARALHKLHPASKEVEDALGKMLNDPDPSVRVESLSALTDLGEAAVPTLIGALGSEKTRYWAALALGEIGEKAKGASEALSTALSDPRPQVRREVLVALARIGDGGAIAVPEIVKHLADPDPAVRHAAAFTLGRMGPAAAGAIDALRKARDSKDHLMETICVWALAHIEPQNQEVRKEAIELLTAVMHDSKSRAQAPALRGLLELEPDPAKVVPVLVRLMEQGDLESIHEALSAAHAYGELGLPVLIAGLSRPEVRGRAAALIAKLGAKGGKAVPAIVAALSDKDVEVRRELLLALALIGPDSAAALPELAKLLSDAEPRVAALAAYAMGSIGEKAASHASQFRKNMESEDPVVRVASAWALVHVTAKPESVAAITIPVLLQGLKNDNPGIRRGSAEALGRLGKAARAAAEPALRGAAKDPDETVRHAALVALEKMGAVVDAVPKAPTEKQ
jgi:HEAT repeat protein